MRKCSLFFHGVGSLFFNRSALTLDFVVFLHFAYTGVSYKQPVEITKLTLNNKVKYSRVVCYMMVYGIRYKINYMVY
jgi:hypothetical protein